jgi:hypothetical protein
MKTDLNIFEEILNLTAFILSDSDY